MEKDKKTHEQVIQTLMAPTFAPSMLLLQPTATVSKQGVGWVI